MNTIHKMSLLAAALLASSVAVAGDTSPLAKVSKVADAQYEYKLNSTGAQEARRVEMDKLNRAVAVVESNLSVDLKRAAMNELVPIDHPMATRALANLLRQAEKSGDALVMREAANAVWYHAAQLSFRNKEANALIGTMRSSQNQVVRNVGAAAQNDMSNFKAKQ